MTTDTTPRAFRTSTPVCTACGKWMGRLPTWDEYLDKGDNCRRCGATFFRWKQCRPIGPKSRLWADAIKTYWEYRESFKDSIFGLADLEESVIR